MKKNTKKIKNFFGKKNLSKLTSLGLSLALGATLSGHAFSQSAGSNSLTTDISGNDPDLNQSIEAHVRVVDDDPIYNIRVDWQDMNFVATITNNANGSIHTIEWTGGGINNGNSSKIWVQNGSSCSVDTAIKYAENHTYFQNIQGQFTQQADAGWKTIAADSARSAGDITGATATADMPLGTMPNGYAIAAPANAAEYTNDGSHDFRGVFALALTGETADDSNTSATPPKRIVGLYDYQSRIAGTTTLTFSKKSDMA
jgi:hypothetical protein